MSISHHHREGLSTQTPPEGHQAIPDPWEGQSSDQQPPIEPPKRGTGGRSEHAPSNHNLSRRALFGAIGAVGALVVVGGGYSASKRLGGSKEADPAQKTPDTQPTTEQASPTVSETANEEVGSLDKFNITPEFRERLDNITLDSLETKTFDEIAEVFTITLADLGLDPTTANPNEFAKTYAEALSAIGEKRLNLFNDSPLIMSTDTNNDDIIAEYGPIDQAMAKGIYGTEQTVSSMDGANDYFSRMIGRLHATNSSYSRTRDDAEYKDMKPYYQSIELNTNSITLTESSTGSFDLSYSSRLSEVDNSEYFAKMVGDGSPLTTPDDGTLTVVLYDVTVQDNALMPAGSSSEIK